MEHPEIHQISGQLFKSLTEVRHDGNFFAVEISRADLSIAAGFCVRLPSPLMRIFYNIRASELAK